MTRCEYVVKLPDFVESVKAYRRMSSQARFAYLLYVWIIPAVCLVIAAYCIYDFSRANAELSTGALLLIGGALGAAIGLPVRYRVGIRRAFNQRNVLTQDRPMFFEFDGTSVRFVVPEGTEITYPWTAFTNYFENEKVAVLFIKDAAFHTIPKRAMGEDGWAQVREFVETHIRKV